MSEINPFGIEINRNGFNGKIIVEDKPQLETNLILDKRLTILSPKLSSVEFNVFDQIIEKCKDDFFYFIDLILCPVCPSGEFGLSHAEHFKQIYRLVKAEPLFTLSDFGEYKIATQNNRHNLKLGLLPRFHGKTRVGTIAMSMWELFKNPDLRILIISEIWDNARDMLRMIRHLYEEIKMTQHSELAYLYWVMGDWVSNVWNEDRIIVKTRKKMGTDPSIATAGMEREITSKHFDLVICDDLIGKSNTQTTDQLKKAIDHYCSLSEVGDININQVTRYYVWGTTWDYADLYSFIMTKLSDYYDILRLRCWDDITNQNPTKVLFPEKFSIESLKDIYYQKMRSSPDQWYTQYLNDPVPKYNAIFNPDYIQWYDYKDIEKKRLTVVITIDPAGTDNEWSDWTAIVAVGIDDDGKRYVLDYAKLKERNPTMIVTKLIQMAKNYYNNRYHNLMMVGIEQGILKNTLEPHILNFAPWIPCVEIPNYNKNKVQRIIECLQPYVMTKQLYLQRWMSDLYDQMVRFPKANVERDVLDALAFHTQLLPLWSKQSEYSPTTKNKDDVFWDWVKNH